MTISEAATILKAIIPGRYFTIECCLHHHPRAMNAEWSIWDGLFNQYFDGPDLAAAVQKVLNAHKIDNSEAVQQVEESFADLMPNEPGEKQ